jgi:hypothetical protein
MKMEKLVGLPRTLGQALGLWATFVVVFIVFGGIGAGITSLIYERLFGEFYDVLYAVVFGAHGLIAYQLLVRWLENRKV